ncbi:phosphotransferase [Aequorivita sp. H23M31]|uniref:Phosphotransferase n=1 Tax=Aequorivita ciconiae TaxID=2494375 RepID=A0A410G7M4_9FLAO|nr:phosphotransferase [Aequorivita sp. H23M31]
MGLHSGGWKLEAGSWRLETGGWRLEAGGWRLEMNIYLTTYFCFLFIKSA